MFGQNIEITAFLAGREVYTTASLVNNDDRKNDDMDLKLNYAYESFVCESAMLHSSISPVFPSH